MVVENLHQFKVDTYNDLYEMYLNGQLGITDQRMPTGLRRMNTKTDGSDEDLIKSLLDADKDNFYHVQFVPVQNGKDFFLITIIGFNITKCIGKDLQYSLNMGEDGVWEDMVDENSYVHADGSKEWSDASGLGGLELQGEIIKIQHTISETII